MFDEDYWQKRNMFWYEELKKRLPKPKLHEGEMIGLSWENQDK